MQWIVLACVLTAGCVARSETASENFGPIQAVSFQCPKAGTRVTFSTGSVTRYTGVDRKNPALCTGVFGNQTSFRRLYNYWNMSPSVIDDVAPAMSELFVAEKGSSVHFVYYDSPIGSGNLSQRYAENWKVLGGEEVKLGNRSVHTTVFEREAAGADATNTSLMRYRLWFAPELGVWLRGNAVMIRGSGLTQSFSVADVIVP